MEREPRFDEEQYELAAALYEYEDQVDEMGFLRSESMPDGVDLMAPNAPYHFEVEPVINQAEYALERAQNNPAWSGDNYRRSRKFRVRRVEGPAPLSL